MFLPECPELCTPCPIKGLEDLPIASASAGGNFAIFLTSEGSLLSLGDNDTGACGVLSVPFDPSDLQIDDPVESPTEIEVYTRKHPETNQLVQVPPEEHRIVQVSCGDIHAVALSTTGKVYSWGAYRTNEGTQAFSKDIRHQHVPLLMDSLENAFIVQIASGDHFDLALSARGEIFEWGFDLELKRPRHALRSGFEFDEMDQLVPHRVQGIPVTKKVVKVFAGGKSRFALTKDGKVYAWGLNACCQLGYVPKEYTDFEPSIEGENPFDSSFYQSLSEEKSRDREEGIEFDEFYWPHRVDALSNINVKKIACGDRHSLALLEDGTVLSFGINDSGAVGQVTSDRNLYFRPTVVNSLVSMKKDIVDIACAGNSSIVLLRSGTFFTFGNNVSWQCGFFMENGDQVSEVYSPQMPPECDFERFKFVHVDAASNFHVMVAERRK